MFTLFTIPKSFENPHINIIQRNAIKSWIALENNIEIFLLGAEYGINEVSREFRIKNCIGIEKNKYNTPVLDSAFSVAKENASYDKLVYVNADIVILRDFLNIFKYLPKHEEFLVAGQRWDIEMNKLLNFEGGSDQDDIKNLVKLNGKRHLPTGSDYFIFNKKSFNNIPSFAVGRIAWDTWMIQEALDKKMLTIDASKIATVIHQNHDYSHQINKGKDKFASIEGKKNILLTQSKNGFKTLKDLEWELSSSGLYKKKSNQDRIFENKIKGRLYKKIKNYKFVISIEKVIKKIFIKYKILKRKELKVIIGSAGTSQLGWISTDKKTLDITKKNDWQFLFKKNSISSILAEHVFEHFTLSEIKTIFLNCRKYLRRGGILRIAVPDAYNPNKDYIDDVSPGGTGFGSDGHKVLLNFKILSDLFEQNNFRVELVEYYNKEGEFNFVEFDESRGHIKRSRLHDRRNQGGAINYTSLIVDGIKK